jgi:serine/threonine protein phosphatase PrpC
MNVHICSGTDPGLERGNNEDSVTYDEDYGLCILADGMGGHNAGEIASGMATAFIKTEMRKQIDEAGKSLKTDYVIHTISESVSMANQAIYSMSKNNPQYKGMGTTLVIGVFKDDTLVLGHIGDSRCYRLRDHQFVQITKDHSVLQEQIDAGLNLSVQDKVPNLLTRGLGTESFVETEINLHTVAVGDIYLMCSDGLSDMLSDVQIASILSVENSLEEKAKQLIDAANQAGGRDNISVVLAKVVDAKKPRLLQSAGRAIQNALTGLRRN